MGKLDKLSVFISLVLCHKLDAAGVRNGYKSWETSCKADGIEDQN